MIQEIEIRNAARWINVCMIEDYGKARWNRLPISEQLFIIAVFMTNYLGAIEFLKNKKALQDYNKK